MRSGNARETFLILERETQELIKDRSQNGPHLDGDTSVGASLDYVNSDADRSHDILKGVEEDFPDSFIKIDDSAIFEIRSADGRLEKTIVTATLKIDIEDHIFVKRLAVMKTLSQLFIDFQFMGHKRAVIDATQGLLQVRHSIFRVKKPETIFCNFSIRPLRWQPSSPT